MIASGLLGGVMGFAGYAGACSLAVAASVGGAVSGVSAFVFGGGINVIAGVCVLCGMVTLVLSAVVRNLVTKREDLVVSE